ncbi:MAG: NADH-quinone oxidoreductase subunit M, partial [Haemophilus parainfluenzae]|jgi:proton-translocating NADH-quinone oxidoreductase, chain M
MNHILSYIIWLPIFFGILVLLCSSKKHLLLARVVALVGSLLGFLVTIPLYLYFSPATAHMQFMEQLPWVNIWHLQYHLGVDGLSVFFLMLNSLITFLVVIAGWQVIQKQTAQYLAAFLIMSGLINGTFASLNAILFYVFFEGMLIPMYLIIGVWGGPRRVYASIKFFLYTLLGSLLMLVALIYLSYLAGGSFEIEDFYRIAHMGLNVQILLFTAFFLSFAVKVPMWPVHTWLPDAHVEAPTGGSMVLAAITLKIGGYGFLRFILPILPDASRYLAPVIVTLSLIAIIYIGFVALIQKDMKKLVAYSSISHMGFVTLGAFLFIGSTLNIIALQGSLLQMISHGFVSAGMFMCIGVLYDRLHTREIAAYGGVANRMPKFAAFMMLFAMADAGLPGTSGFVGEFLVLMGAEQVSFAIAFLAAVTLVLGAGYTLWMYKRVIFGDVANKQVDHLQDINKREFFILTVLAIFVLGMGVYPQFFTELLNASTHHLAELAAVSKI